MVDSRTYAFEGTHPTIHSDASVSREATLVGDVTVGSDVSIWPGVVLRGDIGPVTIGDECHIGDNATVHASSLDEQVMVGHGAVLNEATVEAGSLIGFNATVNTGVTVGEHSIVASGTVMGEGHTIPPESFVRGVPAEVTPLEETTLDARGVFAEYVTEYTGLAARHGDLFD